jgi:SAM-dependent methyltransferase
MATYVCPDCKAPLVDLRCSPCAHQFALSMGFPVLLSNDVRFKSSRELVDTYDSIYAQHSNVWENQGRTPEFIQYFSGLLGQFPARRMLEVGCGEGVLLAAIAADEKHGTELSVKALKKTVEKAQARLAIAIGERLPYRDGYFDLIASVGVMEHFLDDHAASGEICRVLEDGGHYVVLIHEHLSAWQSLRQKISEYVYPQPHPIRLARWLIGKIHRPISQPVQNKFTMAGAKACLERSGFTVTQMIHKKNTPGAPLIGPHVIIFVCRKTTQAAT